jgi:hypothetical protein
LLLLLLDLPLLQFIPQIMASRRVVS